MNEKGLTLLEVLVASVLMAIAVAGLLTSLTTSLRNAARLNDRDRAVMLARSKMDELIAQRRLPVGTVIEGPFDNRTGWRAQVTPLEPPPALSPGTPVLERVQLEVWWMQGEQRRTLTLDGYRNKRLLPEEIPH